MWIVSRAQLGCAAITTLERISHDLPVYGTVAICTCNGMRVIFGMAVSLLLETDAQ